MTGMTWARVSASESIGGCSTEELSLLQKRELRMYQ
jgi:hypothetical protein